MKPRIVPAVLAGLVWAASLPLFAASTITGDLLRDHGLPSGPALKALPQGAVAHLQLNDLLGGLESVEKIILPAVPEQMLPPDARQLLQMEHPLLTVLGGQRFQAPLNEATIAQHLGLDARSPVSLTLYPGDPRRLWILGIPMANRDVLAPVLTGLLAPTEVEEITLGDKTAVRILPSLNENISEVYLVCSETTAFLCGGRSMAVALHSMPTAERLDQDTFVSRALPEVEDQLLNLIVNPDWLKPLALQIQQLRSIGLAQLQQNRGEILRQIPPPVREQIEMQLRTEMGVRDLDEFADYAECILTATVTQFVDWVTNRMLSFEGLTVSMGLGDQAPEFRMQVYSHRFQPDQSAAPIPLDEVREALAWLGQGFDHVRVTGRQPERVPAPVMSAWLKNVMKQFEAKGLESAWFSKLQAAVEGEEAIQPVESRVPWTLTTSSVVQKTKTLDDYDTLLDFLREMPIPVERPVKLVPGRGLDFLETCLAEETSTLNHNREVEADFVKSTTGQDTMFEHVHRFESTALRPDIRRFVTESAWLTRGGLFGYDQHELVNRKIMHARAFDDYLVYHQGSRDAEWLSSLDDESDDGITPAMQKLLDRVPEGANSVEVCRVLHRLPDLIDWLATLEDKIHGEIHDYLENAKQLLDDGSDIEASLTKLSAVPMPLLVYSVNRDKVSGELYCLLPPNIPFPRAKVTPILQKLIAGYAEKANDGGGMLVYTRVRPESFECSMSQSTEALSALISTLGNSWAETYGLGPQAGMKVYGQIRSPRDGSPSVADEVLLVNPRWSQIPGPKPKTDAKPAGSIPHRHAEVPEGSIDLSQSYNASLKDSWHATTLENNTLANLPTGVQEFGGVKFDVRGIIQLSGRGLQEQGTTRYPKCVEGIAVGRKAQKLHFLHAAGWQESEGARIGKYVIRYENGETRERPIRYGADVKDWWHQEDPGDAQVAWNGQSTVSDEAWVSVYLSTWENPLPDAKIRSIDYCSSGTFAAPFLIAITAE